MKRLLARTLTCAAFATLGCSDTPTSPSTTTTTAAVVEPTIIEDFGGTIGLGTSSFYSFTIVQAGTVQVTFSSVGGSNVPATVWMGLGIGQPSGEDCVTTNAINTQAGTSPQLTGTYASGVYCVKITDIGNLVAPARFAISIGHP